jgi:protein-ribulosamine 3-kinase
MHTGEDEVQFLESVIFEAFGYTPEIQDLRLMTGGSINTSVQLVTDRGTYFVKWNDADADDMFRTEALGLTLLHQTETFTIPRVLHQGSRGDKSYLVLEYIEAGPQRATYWEEFGQSLAELHTHTQAEFGLSFNNYIGSLPQRNNCHSDGIEFFIEERLKVQSGLALYNNLISRELYDSFENLYKALPELFPTERPALVHGDLWSGNVITDPQGRVCIIDPAPHYGLREAEIAFTFLFGGFSPAFYASYYEAYPLAENFEERVPIYNLYPLLVHVNLFGQSYVKAVEKTLRRFN